KRVTGTNPSLEKLLKQNKVDVFFADCLAFPYRGVATLSWIPDFQHVHMPDMFNPEECAARDQAFARACPSTRPRPECCRRSLACRPKSTTMIRVTCWRAITCLRSSSTSPTS